ncbi:mannitol dehydrogenase family protein [Xanthomonas translucens]|uniref:mannitol dehydrogenase family protein n=1 Tax=Xanthomonas campestris pv. translucens TaxID=343 RepID=UPI000D226595|nr:mannitol dehydrogenase family protein [Xanthomonas translucens]AVY68432.1 mannitol dehydrogenase [Xanthomonas translucens pv. undulosa]QSQ52409.1 mannitol dehydrogenase family protein [Xanthomonas translucens pv. undulosa]QSQ58671.1 mannitol dehydrogenase family protein [Xanthomonas translucens pv. undulosa]
MTEPRLTAAALPNLPPSIARPTYALDRTRIGIVHLGAGAFHRAHQAVYIDDLLANEPDWAISAVSLHSPQVRDALRPQDGLYALVLLDAHPELRIIGAIREVLCAQDEQPAVLARLADPAVRLVTLTVTEKGYCLAGGPLDVAHPDIVHDLAAAHAPRSAIGYLVAGLRERLRLGLAPYTVLSCNNLPDNGGKLRRAVLQFAHALDPALAAWIEAEATFPRSMVDSITPASDDALRERVAAQLGCEDAWPIQRERYSQWVIEDNFCNGRPAFERAGVTLSDDIAGFDRAKLRLLNGPHSALAYLGSLLGLDTVADAMRHPQLAAFVETLMRDDIAPTLQPTPGFDPQHYTGAILARFRNPAIAHRLAQIAWDGSQKLPVRLLGSIADALAAGRRIDRLCLPIAAWMQFVRRQVRDGVALVDPMSEVLSEIGPRATGDAGHDVDAFLALDAVFAPLSGDARFVEALRSAYAALGDGSPASARQALVPT